MKKIGFYEFNRLPIDTQFEILLKDGVFLTYFKEGDSRANLYALYDFYVETFLIQPNDGFYELICFKKGSNRIDIYLDEIDIDGLF